MPWRGGWLSCLSALISLRSLAAFPPFRRPSCLSFTMLRSQGSSESPQDEAALELYARLRSYNASDPSYGMSLCVGRRSESDRAGSAHRS